MSRSERNDKPIFLILLEQVLPHPYNHAQVSVVGWPEVSGLSRAVCYCFVFERRS